MTSVLSPRFLLAFTEPVEETGEGWTPGGVCFPRDIVVVADLTTATLLLKFPRTLELRDSFLRLYYPNVGLSVHRSKIRKIEIEFSGGERGSLKPVRFDPIRIAEALGADSIRSTYPLRKK